MVMHAERSLDRRRFLRAAPAALLAASLGVADACRSERRASGSLALSRELGSFDRATAWINSPPLSATSLEGRVILVQFCTFSCINWLRTVPFVRAWNDRYGKSGLSVVGAHTPEFSFEHDVNNVRRAMATLQVTHPIAVDNSNGIWEAFENSAWPAVYLFDSQGRLRYRHFGEDEQETVEEMIRKQLEESGARALGPPIGRVEGTGIEAPADWANWKSPENYLGYQKTVNFRSPGGIKPNVRRNYSAPGDLDLNEWGLAGEWMVVPEGVILDAKGGRIAYRFHSRDLNLVMGPRAPRDIRFRVRLDGDRPGAAHGVDLDASGNGTATIQRLYQLIRQPQPIEDRLFEIEFLDPGVEAFSFTFG